MLEKEAVCMVESFSDVGGQLLQGSCRCGCQLLSVTCASHLFLFTCDLVAEKHIMDPSLVIYSTLVPKCLVFMRRIVTNCCWKAYYVFTKDD